jgi:hypothetical protein
LLDSTRKEPPNQCIRIRKDPDQGKKKNLELDWYSEERLDADPRRCFFFLVLFGSCAPDLPFPLELNIPALRSRSRGAEITLPPGGGAQVTNCGSGSGSFLFIKDFEKLYRKKTWWIKKFL